MICSHRLSSWTRNIRCQHVNRQVSRLPACRCLADSSGGTNNQPEVHLDTSQLPEALQGLSINEHGILIDEKSGEVINSLGATRFDVAVTAMRGLLDPPSWVENSERTPGLILGSLVQFPTNYCFSVVGQNTSEYKQFVLDTIARICQTEVAPAAVRCVERLGGKYLSMQVDCMVRAPEIVTMVLAELTNDARTKMSY